MSKAGLLLVRWEDSAQPVSAWMHTADIEHAEAVQCVSVGWCIYADDRVLVLAPNVGEVGKEAEQVSGVIRIPKSCVTDIAELVDDGKGPSPFEARSPQGSGGPGQEPRDWKAAE